MLLETLINTVTTKTATSQKEIFDNLLQIFDIVGAHEFTMRTLTVNNLDNDNMHIIIQKAIELNLINTYYQYDCLSLDCSEITDSLAKPCDFCEENLLFGINNGTHEYEEFYQLNEKLIEEIINSKEEMLFTYLNRNYYENFKLLKKLKLKIIPFLGAGVATPFGLPNWAGLFNDLEVEVIESSRKKYLEIVSKGEFFRAIDYLKENSTHLTNDYRIKEYIREKLKNNLNMEVDISEHNYESFKNLRPKYYLTTNYDTSLSKYLGTSSIRLNEIENFQTLYREEEHKVIHIHGNWDAPSTMIVSREDYKSLYAKENQAFTNKLSSFMGINHFLFIGFSFSDDYFREMYLNILKYLGGEHFIVVPNPDLFDVREYANLHLTTIGINVDTTLDGKLDKKSLVESISYLLDSL